MNWGLPKTQFIHNSLSNTSSPILEQKSHHPISLLSNIMSSLPVRIAKPRHIVLHVESKEPRKNKRSKTPTHIRIRTKKSQFAIWILMQTSKRKKRKSTNTSLTAKVRPARGCLAAGGGGWGKGWSSKRWMKAPKSSLCKTFPFLPLLRVSAKITTPATPTPIRIQSLGLEALACKTFRGFDMNQNRKRLNEFENEQLKVRRRSVGVLGRFWRWS